MRGNNDGENKSSVFNRKSKVLPLRGRKFEAGKSRRFGSEGDRGRNIVYLPLCGFALYKGEYNTCQSHRPAYGRPGRGMGHVLPESLKAAGAEAVFLNHAENPLTLCELAECIKRAKELDIATVVCADSVAEGVAIAELTPDILLCEPTDLIGTGHVADNDYVIQATTRIREVNENIMVMIASGVSTAEDVYNVIKLGADGTGATSGILKAPDPGLRVMEMAKAIVQAVKDREQGEKK